VTSPIIRSTTSWKRIALAIALGLFTSVGVAIVLGIVEPSRTTFQTVPDSVLFKRLDAPGSTLYQEWTLSSDGLTFAPLPDDPSRAFANLRAQDFAAPAPAGFSGNLAMILEWNAEEWGWPTRCLWCWHARPWNGVLIDHGLGIRLPDRQHSLPGTPRFLPLMPMWTGLAINTAIFASAWWLVLLACSINLILHRRRRGQCISCGYDMRSATSGVCPECGTPATTD